jgi:hypothetical protein
VGISSGIITPLTFLFPSEDFVAHLAFSSPSLRNSKVNFINGGLEQMLKPIQDFVFVLNVVILPFPFSVLHKMFFLIFTKFGTKPVARVVVSEK